MLLGQHCHIDGPDEQIAECGFRGIAVPVGHCRAVVGVGVSDGGGPEVEVGGVGAGEGEDGVAGAVACCVEVVWF